MKAGGNALDGHSQLFGFALPAHNSKKNPGCGPGLSEFLVLTIQYARQVPAGDPKK
jgi:hypothetical protein